MDKSKEGREGMRKVCPEVYVGIKGIKECVSLDSEPCLLQMHLALPKHRDPLLPHLPQGKGRYLPRDLQKLPETLPLSPFSTY